jgi:hypothetical protein
MVGGRIGFMELLIVFIFILMSAAMIILAVRFVKKVSNKDAMEDRLGRIEKEIEDLKKCAFGKGKLSSLFFKKGEAPELFCNKKITWKELIPEMLVPFTPKKGTNTNREEKGKFEVIFRYKGKTKKV